MLYSVYEASDRHMKIISILAIGFGASIILPSLLLSAVAFSDAYHRCPGNQCSDAVSSGMVGIFGSIVGLVLAAGGALLLWRYRG